MGSLLKKVLWAELLPFVILIALPGSCQAAPDLQTFFRQNIGLSEDQIASIRNGQPVTKALPSRTPAEVLLFGAIHIHSTPDNYVKFARDFDRLRKLPNYLALGVFSNPPQLSDLKEFSFDSEEIQALQNCRPGNCRLQMPATGIEELQQSINWSAPDVDQQVNQLLQKTALQRLLAYQRDGNEALGVYNDKHNPTEVPKEFAYMLSYSKALPEQLPEFYWYLLAYPNATPAKVENIFYWARVKFGLKPTLRVVHMIVMPGGPAEPVAYAIAEKQLYSSHYFQTALSLSFCVRGSDDAKQPGFYLIMLLGSEQSALAGAKGAIIRKIAIGRSVSNLQNALTSIRNILEGNQ